MGRAVARPVEADPQLTLAARSGGGRREGLVGQDARWLPPTWSIDFKHAGGFGRVGRGLMAERGDGAGAGTPGFDDASWRPSSRGA